jgi:IS4 transposase
LLHKSINTKKAESKSDNKRICFLQSGYYLFNYFWGVRILTNREEVTERQMNLFNDSNEFAIFCDKIVKQVEDDWQRNFGGSGNRRWKKN